MKMARLVQGKILFDEFDSTDLGSNWQVIPDDPKRYSLTERPGYLKAFHGDSNLLILTNETEEYVIDIKNEYVPLSSLVSAGLCAYKSIDTQLEVLEYYDEHKDASFVYQYLRLERTGNVYTAYGRNTDNANWELIGSGEFVSSGKVGISIKGPAVSGASDYNLEYFKMYKSHFVQVLNVPIGYTVELVNALQQSLYASKVKDPCSGVKLRFNDVPPLDGKFNVYDENNILIYTSETLEVVGGDVFFYGAAPFVTVNGENMYMDQEYFLGYFNHNIIPFQVDIYNPYLDEFDNLTLQAVEYDSDPGYKCVYFSLTEKGTYTPSVVIDKLVTNQHVTVYAKVVRDNTVLFKNNMDPFKFNLSLTY